MKDIIDSHPSLKGEVCVAHGINAYLCHQIAQGTISDCKNSMNEQYIKVDDVQEHTTDNAVIKAAIHRHLDSEVRMECPEGCGNPSCQEIILKDLLKELRLDK